MLKSERDLKARDGTLCGSRTARLRHDHGHRESREQELRQLLPSSGAKRRHFLNDEFNTGVIATTSRLPLTC